MTQMEHVQKFVHLPLPPGGATGGQGGLLGVAGAAVAGQWSLTGHWVQLGGEVEANQGRRRLHAIFQTLGRQPRRMSVAEFRGNLAEVVTWAVETERPVLLTSHGRPQAILLSFNVFRRTLKALAHEVLSLRSRRTAVAAQAEDVLADEAAALNARLRGRA